ncbi:MAG: hypothetical protein O7A03_12095 [Alphaproteobacteria bacterium]|nr:hypothetical protein [Alphaproteobacteria bacterium]
MRDAAKGDKPFGDAEAADPAELQRHLMPLISAFNEPRAKRKNE